MARSSSGDSGILYVLLVCVDDVTFSHNGPDGVSHWQYLRERRAGASSRKFPPYSPGCAAMFEIVVVYNGSKLRTGGASDDDKHDAACH